MSSNDSDDGEGGASGAPRYGYDPDVTPRVRFIEDELVRELIEGAYTKTARAEKLFGDTIHKVNNKLQEHGLMITKLRVGLIGEDGKDGRVGALERAVAAIPGHGKWLVAQLIALVIVAVGFAFALAQRTQAIESKQGATDSKVETVDTKVDKLDDKLDALLRASWSKASPPPAGPTLPPQP